MALGCARGARAKSTVASNLPPQFPHYTLQDCINRALKQNPDILVSKKHLEEAAGAIIEAAPDSCRVLPATPVMKSSKPTTPRWQARPDNRTYVWSVYIRLTETVYAGGAVRARMDIARLERQSRTLDFEAQSTRWSWMSVIAFYDILRNKAGVAVHEEAVNFLAEQAKNERAKLNIGTGRSSTSCAPRSTSRWSNRPSWIRAIGSAIPTCASANYCQSPTPPIRIRSPFDINGSLAYEKTTLDLNNCLSRALIQRPELAARENDIKVQKKQLTVDHSELLPHINLFTGYNVVSEPYIPSSADHYGGYVAGAEVDWHIFDGFVTKGRMHETRARTEAAEIVFDATQRNIQTEVLRAYRDLQRAEENIQTQTANVQLATESLSLATANFGLGLTSQLELLQAQLDLTRAQNAGIVGAVRVQCRAGAVAARDGQPVPNRRDALITGGRQMRSWRLLLFGGLLVLGAMPTAAAQINNTPGRMT